MHPFSRDMRKSVNQHVVIVSQASLHDKQLQILPPAVKLPVPTGKANVQK